MNTPRLLDGMPYVPSDKMAPDYLRERFRAIREQQEREKEQLNPTDEPRHE